MTVELGSEIGRQYPWFCNVFRRKWSFFQEFQIFADCFSTTIRYSNLVFLCFSWSTSVVFELKNLHQPYLMFRLDNFAYRLHVNLMKSPIIPYRDGKSTIYQRKWSKSWKILEIQDSVSLFSECQTCSKLVSSGSVFEVFNYVLVA